MPNTTMRKLELKNFTSEQKKFRTVHGKLLLELSIGRPPNEGRTNITWKEALGNVKGAFITYEVTAEKLNHPELSE